MLLTVIILVISTGCTAVNKESDGGKVKVVTTTFALYDFSKQIAGDLAEVTMLNKPGEDIHAYKPTPQEIIAIQNSDIFIYANDKDSWVKNVLSSIDTSEMRIINLMDIVDIIEEDIAPGMDTENYDFATGNTLSDEHVYDEHVWGSPKNSVFIVNEIRKSFVKVDKENAKQYENNASAYIDKLEMLNSEIKDITSTANRNTLYFADKFEAGYFINEYGLKYFAALPAGSTKKKPSSDTVKFLTDKVKNEKPAVIFKSELYDGETAKQLSELCDAQVETFYSCNNITTEDFNNNETYISLMQKNIEAIKKALQ